MLILLKKKKWEILTCVAVRVMQWNGVPHAKLNRLWCKDMIDDSGITVEIAIFNYNVGYDIEKHNNGENY